MLATAAQTWATVRPLVLTAWSNVMTIVSPVSRRPPVPPFARVTLVAKKPIAVLAVGSASALVHPGSATQVPGAAELNPLRRR